MKVLLLSHTPEPERVIASAGKLCYSPVGVEEINKKTTDEQVEKFVNMLANIGHHSPLEHVSFTFAIEGVSRALTHQLVRHRIASYSQQSQRYVREEQFDYIIPEDISKDAALTLDYTELMSSIQQKYDDYVYHLMMNYLEHERYENILNDNLRRLKIDATEFEIWFDEKFVDLEDLRRDYKKLYSALEKKAIENARYLFPNATETKIVVTMNLRTLINFCRHRICSRAQDEIRQLATEMARLIAEESELLGRFLGAPCQFGKCSEGSMSCGRPLPKK